MQLRANGRSELSLVHDTAQAVASPRFRILLLALSVALAAAFATGCSGSGSERPVGVGPNVGAPINLADCSDWNQSDTAGRLGTIQQIKNVAGGPIVGNSASDPSGTGSVLDDKQAYDLFNNYCKENFARGFKLYKLYERAAAFTGHPAQ